MKHALVLGKFMPPHLGHVQLFDFARHFADCLTILVCSRPTDPIPGTERVKWVEEMFPSCRVEHFTESASPQVVDEAFWQRWREQIRQLHLEQVDYLITPEDYGPMLSQQLGARLVPAPGRLTSGTEIRNDPLGCWDFIPERVRPYFVQRICVAACAAGGAGPLAEPLANPLAEALAQRFDTLYVPAYGAPGLSAQERCRAQVAANAAAAYRARRALFLAADALTLDAGAEACAGAARSALYLVGDAALQARIEAGGAPAVLLSGDLAARSAQALQAIATHLPALMAYATD